MKQKIVFVRVLGIPVVHDGVEVKNECCKIAEDFDIEVSNVDNIITIGNTHYAKIKTAGQEYYIELLENCDNITDVTFGYPVKVEMLKFIKDE